jgi:hypothetical protein
MDELAKNHPEGRGIKPTDRIKMIWNEKLSYK